MTMTSKEMMMYDCLVDCGVATTEELNLAFNLIDGGWVEVINRIVYVRTGFNTFDQWLHNGEDDEEE